MKGSDIISKIGVTQIHCSVSKDIFEINPEHDYHILKGTENNPKVVSEFSLEMIKAGKYPRLIIDGMEIVNDVEWTTGHNAFENDIEPRFSPIRPKSYMTE